MEEQNERVLVLDSDDNETIPPGSPQSIISSDSDDVCVDYTEPSVDHCGKTEKNQACRKADAESDSDSENQGCPICFEPWSNSGSHRIASLNCGHLFGRSCIEKWLKGKASEKCPQCNMPARRKDIRNIYCKALRVIDTSEKDRALKELEEEKLKRSKAEEEHMRTKIQFEQARAELERLKEQVKQASFLQQHMVATTSENATLAGPSSKSANKGNSTRPLILQKTIQVSQSKARVMAFDKTYAMMTVSKPSPNQLFPGYGVVKVSLLESRSSEFVSIHQNIIRDLRFNPKGDRLLLSASIDKFVKLTSMTSNTVVQSYTCPSAVWSCCWNDLDTNYINVGLQNGQCLVFDIRKTGEAFKSFQAISGSTCPVVSMAYAPKSPGSEFSAEGLFVCTLNGSAFWELCKDSHLVAHPLSLSPGSFSGLAFDEVSRNFMVSYRPSKFHSTTKHLVYKMSGQGLDSSAQNSLCTCVQTRQFIGGSFSKLLSRAALFSLLNEADSLYAAVGDEASCSAYVWNCNTGAQLHQMPSSDIVLDIASFSSQGQSFLSTLTEKRLSVYKWE